MKVSVIIPSLNPDEKLVTVVDSLIRKGFGDIVLVMMEAMRVICGHLRRLGLIKNVRFLRTMLTEAREEP